MKNLNNYLAAAALVVGLLNLLLMGDRVVANIWFAAAAIITRFK